MPGGKRIGAGRKKGVPNKLNAELKELILGALADAGGRTYLATQATVNPGAFMGLIGKVLPMTIAGTGEGGRHVHRVEVAIIDPAH